MYSLYFTLLRPKRHLCIYDNVSYDTHFSGHSRTTCEYDYCIPTRRYGIEFNNGELYDTWRIRQISGRNRH